MKNYDHKKIEQKWQERWEQSRLYETPDQAEGKENYYVLIEFPYPSGNLHIGHWYAFAVPDMFARKKRMEGKNVLFPIGFDSFGLPAENAAIKRGLDPKKWTYDNIAFMTGQLRRTGNAFDWSRSFATSDPEYYKWDQWLFLRLYENGLAYKKKATVNWCPQDQTVLANEQVIDGVCERCGTEVVQKELEQWFFKTTAYAERLLNDLEPLNWPENVKELQRNWIGKSEGAEIEFQVKRHKEEGNGADEKVKVFTTRPDTLFGATYMVLAPEHQVVSELREAIENWNEVERYIKETRKRSEIERMAEGREKTGVELKGLKAINPATKEEIPIYIADYVLAHYGTGAIMAVPAHDERDYEFATKYRLPIKQVIVPCSIDPKNPPQEGMKEVPRDTVIVHLRDKSTGKYALLNWHGTLEGITTAIMGGIEPGQTPEQAAINEIKEEAALDGVTFTHKLRWITAARYCASHKGENRRAVAHAFLAEVENLDAQGEIPQSEQQAHTLVWVDESEVLERLTPDHQKLVWQLLHKEAPLTEKGFLMNSGQFDGMDSDEAKEKITESVGGRMVTTYKMRDWLLSRQRYWGCPIPIVYDPDGNPHPVPDEHLPWLLPEDVTDFAPKGTSPIGTSKELIERTERIFGKGWRPEIDTMDTFVDSSWYFLRYLDPRNDKEFSSLEKQRLWMPVDRYSGGAEHTTMHVLYSRFFQKALFDLGLATVEEPYLERYNRGIILAEDGRKMSKRWGNVIDPDEQVENVGADTVRMYLGFIGPYQEAGSYPWSFGGIVGVRRFLEKVWRLQDAVSETAENDKEVEILLHKTIKKVGEDIDAFKFNTAIAELMILVNALEKMQHLPAKVYDTLLTILAPFAPHIVEELWERRGHGASVHLEPWPSYDEVLIKAETKTIAIQVSGKTRGTISLPAGTPEKEAVAQARSVAEIEKRLKGREISRIVFVPDRLINFVLAEGEGSGEIA